MTPGERAVWIAVYAAHVHSPQSTGMSGHITREQIALDAAYAAARAVEALRSLADCIATSNTLTDQIAGVLR